MGSYKGETPSLAIDSRIPEFFERFYQVSDDPNAHDDYVNAMTKHGVLIMGTKKAEGSQQLMELRKGLWSGPIKTRKHTLKKIFPFGDNSNECMVYGSVDYELKNSKKVTVDWAAHALFTEESKKLKMAFYQVYLDSAPVVNAAKD